MYLSQYPKKQRRHLRRTLVFTAAVMIPVLVSGAMAMFGDLSFDLEAQLLGFSLMLGIYPGLLLVSSSFQKLFFTRIGVIFEPPPTEELIEKEWSLRRRTGRRFAKNYETLVGLAASQDTANINRFGMARAFEENVWYHDAKLGIETIAELLELQDRGEPMIADQALRRDLSQVQALLECADKFGKKFCFVVGP